MSTLTTPLEVYKLLKKSNCGQCGVATCLAFAAAVIKQEKRLSECPHLDRSTIAQLDGKIARQVNLEIIQEEQQKDLKERISKIDLSLRAGKLGARWTGRTLVVTCLGKDFEIDACGNVASQCHTHAWFTIPLLNYILHGSGQIVANRWVPFRELENGKTWNPLFERRCEVPLKQLADAHSELFEDLISMFSGRTSSNDFASDISVVLHPLPLVPVLVRYWRPEDDLPSRLHLFFDETAEKNLPVESLFILGTGIVRMLEKIMHKHAKNFRELS